MRIVSKFNRVENLQLFAKLMLSRTGQPFLYTFTVKCVCMETGTLGLPLSKHCNNTFFFLKKEEDILPFELVSEFFPGQPWLYHAFKISIFFLWLTLHLIFRIQNYCTLFFSKLASHFFASTLRAKISLSETLAN